MELREYLRVVIKGWWIIIPLMLLSLTVALIFSYSRTPVYEATASYVTTLSASSTKDADTFIYAIDTLTGRQRIPVTYCSILTSGIVREEAYQLMNLDPVPAEMAKYLVSCANLPETNVLFLAVQGSSPELVMALTEAIGLVGMRHANELYIYYPLELLDKPFMDPKPISPKIPQNMVLGTALGLVVGVMTAFMMEYLRSPMEQLSNQSIRHIQLGVFIERYFRERFEQEIKRAYSSYRPLILGIFRLSPNNEFSMFPEAVQFKLLRMALQSIQDSLAQSDLLALVKPKYFGLLLPESTGDLVEEKIIAIQNQLRGSTFNADGYVMDFTMTIGLITSSAEEENYRLMMEKAFRALSIAEDSGKPIYFIRSTPRPFVNPTAATQLPATVKENGSVAPFDADLDSLSEESHPSHATWSVPNFIMNTLATKGNNKPEILPEDDFDPDDDTLADRPAFLDDEEFHSRWFDPQNQNPWD